ncbi:MAG: rhamnosyltransferase WsaF family glycosyltransferase [Bryobacteraceae bacterium]
MERSDSQPYDQFSEQLTIHRDLARRLAAEVRLLRGELDAVYASPAWRISSYYRWWLRRMQHRWPTVHRAWAWAANHVVGLLSGKADPAGSYAGRPQPERDLLSYQEWIEAAEPSEQEIQLQAKLAVNLAYRPCISVLLPVFRIPSEILLACVNSVLVQSYDRWQLCIAHGDPDDHDARRYLSTVAEADPRVQVQFLESNRGIAANTNAALEMATGEFIALLDHDDALAPFALFEVACALNDHPEADFLYSDKDRLSADGRLRFWPFFKPDWSPHLMLSANYLTHLCVVRTELARRVGGFRPEMDGAQDWDFYLRLTRQTRRIVHIPKVLYHWRETQASTSSKLAAKPYAVRAIQRCLTEHMAACGWNAGAIVGPDGSVRFRWDRSKLPSASIVAVIPEMESILCSRLAKLEQCAGAAPVELLAVLGKPSCSLRPPWKVLGAAAKESLAETLNRAAGEASGEILVFVDPVLSGEEGWLYELLGPFQDPAVGVVGAQLLDSQSGLIRHMGIVFQPDGGPAELFGGMPQSCDEPFGNTHWYRDVLAVSGACMAVRRKAFLQAGGFRKDPLYYPRLDLDLCLRIRLELGLDVVCTPFAYLWQTGTSALGPALRTCDERTARARFQAAFPEGDPFFNRNLYQRPGSLQLRLPLKEVESQQHELVIPANAPLSFDFTATELEQSRAACTGPPLGELRSLVWFTPEVPSAQYGGIYTILRFADYFRRAHGTQSTFVFLPPAEEWLVRRRIRAAFPELAEHCKIAILAPPFRPDDLGSADAGIATEWRTAYTLLRYNRVRRKFYFVQDDESLFHPAGTLSALADETYRFGFLGICNSIGVRNRYALRGGVCEHFDPCVDTRLFYPAGAVGRDRRQEPLTVFWYARPSYPRNCFEILADALRLLKQRMGSQVRIVAAGEDWDPKSWGLKGVVENLGLLTYRQSAALYRSCHAGVVCMMTCHPSYIPLELMASGALVVSNLNLHTSWLLQHRVNSLITKCSASCIADALEEGLIDADLRTRLTSEALTLIQERYSRWDEQAEKTYRFMVSC